MRARTENGVAAARPPGSAGLELGPARAMIGRRLRLRSPLLGFEAGTPCRVQCVVDFGDGLLLWVTTDDGRQLDVDQIDAEDLERFFIASDAGATPDVGSERSPPSAVGAWGMDGDGASTPSSLRGRLSRLGGVIAAFGASLRRSLENARYADWLLSMSDAGLAARGLRRDQVMDHLLERACRTD